MVDDIHDVHIVLVILYCTQEFLAFSIYKVSCSMAVCRQHPVNYVIPHSGMGCSSDSLSPGHQFLCLFHMFALKIFLEVIGIYFRNVPVLNGLAVSGECPLSQ